MRHFFRSAVVVSTLLAGVSFAGAERAEARSSFSFSVGVPIGGYYGGPSGGFYGGSFGYGQGFGRGYGRGCGPGFSGGPRWSAYYQGGFPSFYDPFYRPYGYSSYYAPRYYAPTYVPTSYGRPYLRPHFAPIVSLSLFPAYVGDTLTYEDRGLYYSAYQRALTAPIGEAVDWDGTRARGAVTTTRDGWAGEKYCREFRQDVSINGRLEEVYGTACRQPDGDWRLVANQ